MRLVDSNYNFECDWLIELSNNIGETNHNRENCKFYDNRTLIKHRTPIKRRPRKNAGSKLPIFN